MQDALVWMKLFCLLGGGAVFFIGRLIEKTQHLKEVITKEESPSTIGSKMTWTGMALFGLGMLLIYFA